MEITVSDCRLGLFLTVLVSALVLMLGAVAHGQEYDPPGDPSGQTILPQSTGIYGNISTNIQINTPIKRFDGSVDEVHPFYQYLELSVVDPKSGFSFNTFMRAREVLDGDDATFDVYNAFLEYTSPWRNLQVRLGRQPLTESTNFTLLDGALVRFSPTSGIELVAYGGYQDRDAQPDPEEPLESFGVYGIKIKSDELLGSLITLGYEGLDPDNFSSRHFLNLTFHRALPFTDLADVYSRLEFDIEEANPAQLTIGAGVSPVSSLYLNLEYGTYKPDDDRSEFLQDPVFDIFSVSRLHEARLGVTYFATEHLEIVSSYSFARYDVSDGVSTNGSIVKLNFNWDFWQSLGLKAYQGFYFIDGREDDRAIGLNLNVSEEIIRGLVLQFTFAYAHFEKLTGKDGNAFSYIIGAEYLLIRNLALRAELEVNSNPDFDDDIRTNLGVSYYF